MASSGRKAGWYSDPAKPARYRFWDSTGWTHWVARTNSAPAPPSLDPNPVPPITDRADRIVTALKWTALVVAIVVVVATAVGVTLNRRDHPLLDLNRTPSPAPTLSVDPDELIVQESRIRIGTAVTIQAPQGWSIQDPAPADGLFDPIAFMTSPGAERKASLPLSYAGVGLSDVTILPEQAQLSAATLVQVSADRLYRDMPGVVVGPPTATPLTTFGAEHPGAAAKVTITWQGDSTVMELRIVKVTATTWMVWLLNDGPEVSDADRAARELAWRGVTFHDS